MQPTQIKQPLRKSKHTLLPTDPAPQRALLTYMQTQAEPHRVSSAYLHRLGWRRKLLPAMVWVTRKGTDVEN